MAKESVIIDVIAQFKDKTSSGASKVKKSIRDIDNATTNLNKKKTTVKVGVNDKATPTLRKITSSASSFAKKAWKGTLSVLDKASSTITNVNGKARSFAGKVWKSTLSVVDRFTSPLTKLKNMLFSINTLIATVATGLATKLVVAEPVQLADSITTSTIFFETKLGSKDAGNSMMSDIMEFAKTTPFDTQGVVDGVKSMMAYGIETENVMEYMEKIGNVTSAMGAGEAGIESITRALGQMKSAGRVNAQDMMQLTSVGVTAWDYLAKGMGKTVAEVRELSQDGELAADEAIKHIMNGLSEYDGMMDKMSNTTVSGLWSNIQDTFSQSIVLKWGQGLQSGAIDGLVKFRDWLERIDPLLSRAGTSLEDLGKGLSTKVFDILGGITDRFEEAVTSDAFKNASLGGKIGILWDEVIWEPFSEWWEGTGKPKIAEKLYGFGEGLGSGISNALLTILGVDVEESLTEGVSLGQSFAEGFAEGFDGEAVGEALWNAIKSVFANGAKGLADLLIPGDLGTTAGQKILGAGLGYFGLTAGAKLFTSGKSLYTGAKNLWGTPGNYMFTGTGLSSKLASIGYKLHGTNAGMYFGGGAGLSSAGATALGAGSVAGGIAAGATLLSAGGDFYNAYRANKYGDKIERNASTASGIFKVGGVGAGAAAGAAIGSAFGGIGAVPGALIGAGIGGIAGWLGGNKAAEDIRKAKYESEELAETLANSEASSEEISQAFQKAVDTHLADHFGDIELSLKEIDALANNIVFGDNLASFESFASAVDAAERSFINLQASTDELNKWNWRASIGVKFNSDDMSSFEASVDSFIANAEQYIEDEHYEFTAAVSLLIDPKSEDGKSIIGNADSFYSALQEEASKLGTQLKDKVSGALKDGIITLDEQAEIQNLQEQIASITNKLAEAQTEAEFETIKIKFGSGNLTDESFTELQTQLQSTVESANLELDSALTTSIASLNLQFDEKAITEEEYNAAYNELVAGYTAKVDSLNAQVTDVQLEILGDAYTDLLGDDAKANLQNAINESVKTGIDPVTWSSEELASLLGLQSISEEGAAAISGFLSQIVSSMATSMSELPTNTVTESLGTNLTNSFSTLPTLITPETFTGVTSSISTNLGNSITAVDVTDPTATMKSNVDSTIKSAFSVGGNFSYPLTITPYLTKSSFTVSGGGTSQAVNFTIGSNANGGYIGSKTLSWLAEEGYPEMVIPFAPHRRGRALSLWERAGELLGVETQNNAVGGIVGADLNENPSSKVSVDKGGSGSTEVKIENITFDIKTEGGSTDILAAIKSQEQAIVSLVSKALFEAVQEASENTPMAKG